MRPLLIVSLFCLLCIACKKKEATPEPVKKTNYEYLTAGKWQIVSVEEKKKQGGDTITGKVNYAACALDNYDVYNTNGRVITYNAGIKCSPNEPAADSPTVWKLINNDSQLQISFVTDTPHVLKVLGIAELNDNNFIFTHDMNYADTNGRFMTYTCKKVQ